MSEFTKEQGGVGAYCPFCGDERNLVEIGVPFDDGICHVECARCGARGPVESAEDRAISAWNLRAGGPAERPALNAKEFSREELETLAGLSAFESNPVVRLAQVAAFALSQMERAEAAEGKTAEWLCERCNMIHPPQPGCTVFQPCPDCGEAMTPTSPNRRRIDELEAALRQAEAERDRLKGELDEADGAINSLYDWAYAQTYTMEEDAITHYVTPEMAHDAGDPSMAGAPVYEKVSCEFCLAESGEPWRDLMDSNSAVRRARERGAQKDETPK